MTSDALTWATASGADMEEVLYAWRGGRSAGVPIGRLWEVCRVTSAIALGAIGRLQAAAVPMGPIVEVLTLGLVEFVVRPGTTGAWPPGMQGTACVARGTLRCPPPQTIIGTGRVASGRRWVVPPTGIVMPPASMPTPWTDNNELCEAVAAASVHAVSPYLPSRPQVTHPGPGPSRSHPVESPP